MSTCNWLDLPTLGSQPIMPKNLPDHCIPQLHPYGVEMFSASPVMNIKPWKITSDPVSRPQVSQLVISTPKFTNWDTNKGIPFTYFHTSNPSFCILHTKLLGLKNMNAIYKELLGFPVEPHVHSGTHSFRFDGSTMMTEKKCRVHPQLDISITCNERWRDKVNV